MRLVMQIVARCVLRQRPAHQSADVLAERLRDAEDDFKLEVNRRQWRLRYRVHRGRLCFDKELRDRRLKQSIPSYIRQGNVLSPLTAPLIYSLLLPIVVLDMWVTLYQWMCLPIYGVCRVPRRRFFTIDRHKLAYLNGIAQLNCTFCSYANGLVAYVREVAARTEQYGCPIKHARRLPDQHSRSEHYCEWGDAAGYRSGLAAPRRQLISKPPSRRGNK